LPKTACWGEIRLWIIIKKKKSVTAGFREGLAGKNTEKYQTGERGRRELTKKPGNLYKAGNQV